MKISRDGVLVRCTRSHPESLSALPRHVGGTNHLRCLEGFAVIERPRHFEGSVWQALDERLIIALRAARLPEISVKETEAVLEERSIRR